VFAIYGRSLRTTADHRGNDDDDDDDDDDDGGDDNSNSAGNAGEADAECRCSRLGLTSMTMTT